MSKELVSLLSIDKAILFINQASVAQLTELINQAEAVRVYVSQSKKSLTLQNQAVEIKLRAERKLSEWYENQTKNKGGKQPLAPMQVVKTVKEMGLEHTKLHRLKQIAMLPEKEFEAHIAEVKKSNEELTTTGLIKLARSFEHKEKVQKIQDDFESSSLPDKKYSIIYADPPWEYFAGGLKNQSRHYKNMSIDEITLLPIEDLANDDCILFLWVTFPMLKECFKVIEAWGFEYSTCGFVWVKQTKNTDKPFFGLGNWTRSNAELCLIATKGSIKRMDASISQVIMTPIQEHSKKPDIIRDKIVQLVGDLPRIELFARNKSKDWDVWGNET